MNNFQAVESIDDLLDTFMSNYGKPENYLRCFGGLVVADTTKTGIDVYGLLTVPFSRPVVFPTDLIKLYNHDY